MRVFILLALLAMATTVSAQSAACNSSIAVIDANTTITALTPTASGCTDLDPNNDTQCTSADGFSYTCFCAATYANASAWELAVTGAGGRACYLSYEYSYVGTVVVGNVSRSVSYNASQTGVAIFALGGACNDTDIKTFIAPRVTEVTETLTSTATTLKKNNATWTSGSVKLSICTSTTIITRDFAGAGTPTPTATPSSTSNPTNSTNTNGTTPTPTPTATPTPTTTPTPPSSTGSGASIIASSAALVASLIAAVIIAA